MHNIPIVIAKPKEPPFGSNFDFINPGIGVKIAEGKRTKNPGTFYEDIIGKTSKAKYLDQQEKNGIFQSGMKEKLN